jgi:membrane protease YdiL (CAAX protease family)
MSPEHNNMTNNGSTNFFSKKRDSVLILLLLFLGIPFRLVIGYFYNPFPTWAANTIPLGTYLILGILVWLHRANLHQYQIGKSTVWIFILSGTVFQFGNPFPVNIFFGIIGISLLVLYLKNTFSFEFRSSRLFWFVICCFIGIGLPILLSSILFLLRPNTTSIFKPWPGLFAGGIYFFYHLSHASILEELTFRGFLWGFLIERGWSEGRTWFLTTILTWIAHLFYFNDPFTFWVAVPIIGTVLGYIKWRSQSVSYSVFVHALYNTMSIFT